MDLNFFLDSLLLKKINKHKGSEGVQQYQNSLHFKFFPISGGGGGGHRKSIFSQIQKSPKPPRGVGGVKKIMDFFHNLGHFFLDGSPNQKFALTE